MDRYILRKEIEFRNNAFEGKANNANSMRRYEAVKKSRETLLKRIKINKVLAGAAPEPAKKAVKEPELNTVMPELDSRYNTSEDRTQRASMLLKDVCYGIEFHFEMTGLKSTNDVEDEKKHYNIIKRRLEKGQYFRTPCFGCAEFPVRKIQLAEDFDLNSISPEITAMGDVDLGFMSYKVVFDDNGIPLNNNWDDPVFSDKASTLYYRPHMINGIIDVRQYRGMMKC